VDLQTDVEVLPGEEFGPAPRVSHGRERMPDGPPPTLTDPEGTRNPTSDMPPTVERSGPARRWRTWPRQMRFRCNGSS
jgi:hypothetical protein